MKRNELLQKIMPVISAFTVVASTYAALNSSIAGSNDDLLATIVAMEECGRGVQRLRFKTTRFSELMNPECFSEKDFKQRFRLPRSVFYDVLERIETHPVFHAPANVGCRKISVEKQLACFLMRVGGVEAVAKIRSELAISESSVSIFTRRVATAIINRLGCYVGMPRNGSKRKADVKKIFENRDIALKGAVGIIDCTSIPIVVPTRDRKDGNAYVYHNRKCQASLSVQAITTCEDCPRFLSIFGACPGSYYDTRIFYESSVYKNLGKFLEPDEFLMGDCGYFIKPWMMRGWSNSELKEDNPRNIHRRSFNRLYSSVRISIERAFGILKARFQGLSKKIWFRRLEDYQSCIHACAILHNICAEANAVSFPSLR